MLPNAWGSDMPERDNAGTSDSETATLPQEGTGGPLATVAGWLKCAWRWLSLSRS